MSVDSSGPRQAPQNSAASHRAMQPQPMQVPTTLEGLIQAGIKNQRRQLQQYVFARNSGGEGVFASTRFVCAVCESQSTPHAGWADFNQDNILGHYKSKHREISIYSSEQFSNARKRRQVSVQPSIASKFPKIEKSTGVELAVQLMRKLPGTPLSHFDSPDFLRAWGDNAKGVNRKSVTKCVHRRGFYSIDNAPYFKHCINQQCKKGILSNISRRVSMSDDRIRKACSSKRFDSARQIQASSLLDACSL